MSFAGPVTPLPVVLIHGTSDPLVPFNGGMASLWGFRPRGEGRSAPATAKYYADRNGIGVAPTTRDRDGYAVTTWTQPGCDPVELRTVRGGGHTIPGCRRAPFVMGRRRAAERN